MNTGGKSPVFSPVGGANEAAHIPFPSWEGRAVVQGRKTTEMNTFQNRRKEVSNMAVFRIEKTRDYKTVKTVANGTHTYPSCRDVRSKPPAYCIMGEKRISCKICI